MIVRIDEASDWVSGMVATEKKKPGAIRLCIDHRPLSKALKTPMYPLLTIEDILQRLQQAKMFTV